MLATLLALCAQTSLLVKPLELGESPPQTRAVAAVSFDLASGSTSATAAEEWRAKAERGHEFAAFAKVCATQPRAGMGGMYGTFYRSLLAADVGEFLFGADEGQVVRSAESGAAGRVLVAQRLARDAACRQVLVSGADPSARARAEAILRELRAGADFAVVARERSDDRASALRGGALAIFERGARDSLLRAAAFDAELGEIVGPLQTPLGFHLVQRVAVDALDPRLRDDVWARARGILISFSGARGALPTVEREAQEAHELAAELVLRARLGEDLARLAREFDDDRGGRERAGDLGWIRRQTTDVPNGFDRLFSEPPGTLIGPLALPEGYLIARREDPGVRSWVEVGVRAFAEYESAARVGTLWGGGAGSTAEAELARARGALLAALGGAATDAAREWLDPLVARCGSAEDLVRVLRATPPALDPPGNSVPQLRSLALGYANALAALQSSFLESEWPVRSTALEAALAGVRVELGTLGRSVLDLVLADCQLADPRVVVQVDLILEPRQAGTVVEFARESERSCRLRVSVEGASDSEVLRRIVHGLTGVLALAELDRRGVPAALESRCGQPLRGTALDYLLCAEAERALAKVYGVPGAAHASYSITLERARGLGHVALGDPELDPLRARRQREVARVWSEHLESGRALDQTLSALVAACD